MDATAEEVQAKIAAVAEGLGRTVRVFTHDALRNQSRAESISDVPDDFYDLTQEDVFRLMRSKKEDNYLKTKRIREAEIAARRAKITQAVIRVLFPDDYVLEATFQPTETISVLMDLVKRVIAQPDLPFYLYTTPPKKKITNVTQDFFAAQLIPRAIVRFDYDVPEGEKKGPFLCDEIKALCNLHQLLVPKEDAKTHDADHATEPQPESSFDMPVAKKEMKAKPKWLRM